MSPKCDCSDDVRDLKEQIKILKECMSSSYEKMAKVAAGMQGLARGDLGPKGNDEDGMGMEEKKNKVHDPGLFWGPPRVFEPLKQHESGMVQEGEKHKVTGPSLFWGSPRVYEPLRQHEDEMGPGEKKNEVTRPSLFEPLKQCEDEMGMEREKIKVTGPGLLGAPPKRFDPLKEHEDEMGLNEKKRMVPTSPFGFPLEWKPSEDTAGPSTEDNTKPSTVENNTEPSTMGIRRRLTVGNNRKTSPLGARRRLTMAYRKPYTMGTTTGLSTEGSTKLSTAGTTRPSTCGIVETVLISPLTPYIIASLPSNDRDAILTRFGNPTRGSIRSSIEDKEPGWKDLVFRIEYHPSDSETSKDGNH